MDPAQSYSELENLKDKISEKLYLNGLVFLHNAVFYNILPEYIHEINDKLIFIFNSKTMLAFIITQDGKISISTLENTTKYTVINIDLSPYCISIPESFILIKKYFA